MSLNREQAEALAGVVVPALRQHASSVLTSLSDDEKNEMHPQAFAALDTLSNIKGTFCEVAPQIDDAIKNLGWLAKKFLGSAYALLLTFQTVIHEIAKPLCGTASGSGTASATGTATGTGMATGGAQKRS